MSSSVICRGDHFFFNSFWLIYVHNASVRDRILHHAIFCILNPLYDKTFIANSFSCRIDKGTPKGVLAVERIIRSENRNFTRPCFALKCNVRKFFDSIDHRIKNPDPQIVALLAEIDGIRGEFKSGLRMTPQAITNLKKSTLITTQFRLG